MCYDVSLSHRIALDKNQKRMDEIQKEKGVEVFKDEEWCRLDAENAIHYYEINRYEQNVHKGIFY